MFNRLRGIRAKIMFGFAAVIIVFILAILGSTIFQAKVTMLTEQINRNYSKLSMVQKLTDDIRTADGLAARYVMSNTTEERTANLTAYEAKIPEITASVEELKGAGLNEAELAGIQNLEGEWDNYLTVLEQAFALAKEGNFPQAQKSFTSLSLTTIIDSQLVFETMLHDEIMKEQSQAATHRRLLYDYQHGGDGIIGGTGSVDRIRIVCPDTEAGERCQQAASGDCRRRCRSNPQA